MAQGCGQLALDGLLEAYALRVDERIEGVVLWLWSVAHVRSSPLRSVSTLSAIHRSAWKWNSRKFGFRIVHKSPPESREHRFWGHSCRVREVYILWLCIDMRDLDFRER